MSSEKRTRRAKCSHPQHCPWEPWVWLCAVPRRALAGPCPASPASPVVVGPRPASLPSLDTGHFLVLAGSRSRRGPEGQGPAPWGSVSCALRSLSHRPLVPGPHLHCDTAASGLLALSVVSDPTAGPLNLRAAIRSCTGESAVLLGGRGQPGMSRCPLPRGLAWRGLSGTLPLRCGLPLPCPALALPGHPRWKWDPGLCPCPQLPWVSWRRPCRGCGLSFPVQVAALAGRRGTQPLARGCAASEG